MPSFDSKRLYSALLNSGLQNKDPALYQVIYQLIGALVGAQNSITTLITGSSSSSSVSEEVTNIFQILSGGRSSESGYNRVIPGPRGETGAAGINGASLPGPLGIIRHYVEMYPRYIPIMGNQGNPGTTGAAGPIAPVIPSKRTETVKSPIQIFQTVSGSSGGSGSYVWLATRTGSGGATLEFKSLINSTYDSYDFVLHNIVMDTDNIDFLMRTSTDNGSTFDSGASDYAYASFINNTGASTDNVASAAASSIRLMPDADNAANIGSICGTITLINPLNSSVYKHMNYHLSYRNNNNQFYNFQGSAWRLAVADIDAVQFLTSASHNISSGFIEMFGRKNS